MNNRDYAVLPSSQAVDMMFRTVNRDIDPKWIVEESRDGNSARIKAKGKSTETTIWIKSRTAFLHQEGYEPKERKKPREPDKPEPAETRRNGKGTKKILLYILQTAAEQKVSAEKPEIYIDLNELVRIGMYKTVWSARVAVNNAYSVLSLLELEGTVKRGKRVIKQTRQSIFIGIEDNLGNNTAKIRLNPNIKTEMLFQFCTILPMDAYKLSNKAFDLLYTAFYLGRQNKQKLKQTRRFTISINTVKKRLRLPERSKNKKRDVEEPITASTKEINNTFGDRVKMKWENGEDEIKVTFCAEYVRKMTGSKPIDEAKNTLRLG